MTVVTRRKIRTELTHEADGTVSRIRVSVQYTQDNDLNKSLNLVQQEWITMGPDDMTTGDKTSATAFASRLEDMIERVRPLVNPQE